jgi:outer membrane protein TolC
MFMLSPSNAACVPRKLRRWLSLLALCAALPGPFAVAQPALSLDQALRTAQDRSQQLVAQDAAAAASRDMAIAAGELPDPTLTVGINNLPVDGPDAWSLTSDFMTMRSIGVMQEFTRGDKRKARSARFAREADVAEAGRSLALTELQRDTATAWFERYFQEGILAVLLTQRDETRLQVEAAEAAYRSGRGSQSDVFAARSAAAQIDDRILQSEQKIRVARTRLSRWVGDDAGRPLAAPPSLTVVRLDPGSLEADLAHHPQVDLMGRQEDVARAEAAVAQSNRSPDWSVALMYSQRGSAYSNMVSINVSIPLQLGRANRQDREYAAKLALADQLRAQREEATRGHLAEVKGWLQQWQGNRERLAFYASAIVPLAGERTRAALAAYRGGGGTLAAVLEARRTEIDTRIEQIRLEAETAELWAQLEYLMPVEPIAVVRDRRASTQITAGEK